MRWLLFGVALFAFPGEVNAGFVIQSAERSFFGGASGSKAVNFRDTSPPPLGINSTEYHASYDLGPTRNSSILERITTYITPWQLGFSRDANYEINDEGESTSIFYQHEMTVHFDVLDHPAPVEVWQQSFFDTIPVGFATRELQIRDMATGDVQFQYGGAYGGGQSGLSLYGAGDPSIRSTTLPMGSYSFHLLATDQPIGAGYWQMMPVHSAGIVVVPEPTTISLLIAVALAAARYRRT